MIKWECTSCSRHYGYMPEFCMTCGGDVFAED